AVFDPLGLRESSGRPSSVPPPLPTTTPTHGTDPATLVMARRAPPAPPAPAPPAPTPLAPEAPAAEPPRPASPPPRPGGAAGALEVDLANDALDSSDAPGLGAPRRS